MGAPWPTFPPQLASKRTIGPALRWQQRETGPSGQPGVGLALPPKATPEDLLPRSWDASAPNLFPPARLSKRSEGRNAPCIRWGV